MPNVSRHDKYKDTWQRMLDAGVTPGEIAIVYHTTQRVVRYVTDPAYRENAQATARQWHRETRSALKATLSERKTWTAAPAGFTALPSVEPEPVVVEYFSHMPAWRYPLYLAIYEAYRK